jgi:alpha-tubulin suppressor-like RCC1 family protein
LSNPQVDRELLPKPVEALQGIRVGSIAAVIARSYAVADTGELWAWGFGDHKQSPLGHDEPDNCRLPKRIRSLQGVRMDALTASGYHTLAVTSDSSVYAWGDKWPAGAGALGLGPPVPILGATVPQPQRIPTLRV